MLLLQVLVHFSYLGFYLMTLQETQTEKILNRNKTKIMNLLNY